MKIWPQDWDLHIIKSSEVLFDTSNNPVEFISANSRFSTLFLPSDFLNTNFEQLVDEQLSTINTILSSIYSYNMKYYNIVFSWSANGYPIGKAYWKKISFIGDCLTSYDIESSPSECIGYIYGHNAFECCEKIKLMIINHNRGGNDEDYDPIDYPDPAGTLDLQTA